MVKKGEESLEGKRRGERGRVEGNWGYCGFWRSMQPGDYSDQPWSPDGG